MNQWVNSALSQFSNESMNQFFLRLATTDDEPFLYLLYCSTRRDEMSAWGWDAEQQETFLRMQFRAQQYHYQTQSGDVSHNLILSGDEPIGRIIVMRSDQEICLGDIALLPEHRGHGIGTALIADLFAEAKKTGKPVTLHVEKTNPAAGLYSRLGFRVTGDTGSHLKMEWRTKYDEGITR